MMDTLFKLNISKSVNLIKESVVKTIIKKCPSGYVPYEVVCGQYINSSLIHKIKKFLKFRILHIWIYQAVYSYKRFIPVKV